MRNNGNRDDKPFRNALLAALTDDRKALGVVAARLHLMAEAGDLQAAGLAERLHRFQREAVR